ncbi:hypothetical protein N9L68_04990 [bacterium]|nr:hypothetical protein [bacterium]
MVKKLLEDMQKSIAVAHLRLKAYQSQRAKPRAKAAPSGGPKKRAHQNAEKVEDPDKELNETGRSFLDHYEDLCIFMKSLHEKFTGPVSDAFAAIAMKALMEDKTEIASKKATTKDGKESKSNIIKKWRTLRLLFKSEIYRRAKLQPRLRDADFDALTSMVTDGIANEDDDALSLAQAGNLLEVCKAHGSLEPLAKFVDTCDPSKRATFHVTTATAWNITMMALLQRSLHDPEWRHALEA